MSHEQGMSKFQMAHLVGELALITAVCSYFQSKTKNLEERIDSLQDEVDKQRTSIMNLENIVMRNKNTRGRRDLLTPDRSLLHRTPPIARKKPTVRNIQVSQETDGSDDEIEEITAKPAQPNLLSMVAPALQALAGATSPAMVTASPVEIENVDTENDMLISDSELKAELADLKESKASEENVST